MNGIVVIDKPAGLTSHDVVAEVKRRLKAARVGHTGTLDPMATGVLPVCLNEATKLSQFLVSDHKTYRAVMLLGVRTDTQDTQGQVLARSDPFVSEADIRQAIKRMEGRIRQVPPVYSALKYKGQPLYRYARRGESPDMPAREVEIYDIAVREVAMPCVTFDVSCSKGTYIRTLCSDIGEALGCGACLSGLRRLKSGLFSEEMAVPLFKDGYPVPPETFLEAMLPMTRCLPAMHEIELDAAGSKRLRNGYQPDAGSLTGHVPAFLVAGDMIKFIDSSGDLAAVAEMIIDGRALTGSRKEDQAARVIRVFKGGV